MRKNYGLGNYITQNNNFIVYEEFFNQNSINNKDTEFDNETFRVIQNLKTPQYLNKYKYSTDNFRRYMSGRSIRLNNVQSPSPRIYYNLNQFNKKYPDNSYKNNDNDSNYNREHIYPNNDNYNDNYYRNNDNYANNNYRNNDNYNNNFNNNNYRNNNNNNYIDNNYKNKDKDNNYGNNEKIYKNNDSNNNYRMNENEKNPSKAMSETGKKLIFTNDFTNNVVNKEVYKNPSKGFQKYYFNKEDSLAYDNIYSRQKMLLINDYMASKMQTPDEFVEEQNNINQNSINNSNQRLNELTDKISDIKGNNRYQPDQLFIKRYNYATLFDDKKLAQHDYNRQNQNLHRSVDFINEQQYQDYQNNKMINNRRTPRSSQRYSPYIQNGNNYNDNPMQKSTQYYRNNYNDNQNDEYNNDNKRQNPNRRYY
jgi:hypothetical protein